jgi:anthranilate phosphoribosyltransferase
VVLLIFVDQSTKVSLSIAIITMSTTSDANDVSFVSISPLLKRLSTVESAQNVPPQDVAAALALIFENRVSPVQFSLLLWALHTTHFDHQAAVLAECAASMRLAGAQADKSALRAVVERKARGEGKYNGGLVSTFPSLSEVSH